MEKLFPTILVILDVGAGIVYAIGGDWWRFAYWFSAGLLTVCVTWGIK